SPTRPHARCSRGSSRPTRPTARRCAPSSRRSRSSRCCPVVPSSSRPITAARRRTCSSCSRTCPTPGRRSSSRRKSPRPPAWRPIRAARRDAALMARLLDLILSAVLLAGLHATMAYGLGLIYGVLRVVNLAHGGVIMAGAYLGWCLHEGFGLDPYLSIPIVMAATFLLGVVLYQGLVRRLPR